MYKKKIRDILKLLSALILSVLYIPHILIFFISNAKSDIRDDLQKLRTKINIKIPIFLSFLFYIHNDSYFRRIFYHRIGPVLSLLIGWWRPGNRYFKIQNDCKLGGGVIFAHPYATILNARSIGRNFDFRHLTTLGSKGVGVPEIGDNVLLGAAVTIIGDIKIGNNVIVGAGSVVTKNVPDNCIVAGNPARIIKYREQ